MSKTIRSPAAADPTLSDLCNQQVDQKLVTLVAARGGARYS